MRDSDIDSLTANGAQESPPRPLSRQPQLDRPDFEELRRLAEAIKDGYGEDSGATYFLDTKDSYKMARLLSPDTVLALLSERQDLELQDLELQNVGLEVSARGWMDRANAAERRIAELRTVLDGIRDYPSEHGSYCKAVFNGADPRCGCGLSDLLVKADSLIEESAGLLSSSGGDKE